MTNSVTQGLHHLGLTVSALAPAVDFFVRVLGFEKIAEKPDYPAAFVSDGSAVLTLWEATNGKEATAFDRKTIVGLHHFALRVRNGQSLEALHEQLAAEPGVVIEFAPENVGGGPSRHFICRIPGGLRLELVAPAI